MDKRLENTLSNLSAALYLATRDINGLLHPKEERTGAHESGRMGGDGI